MATMQIDLETIVAKPTWKDILLEQIETKKLNPWDIDIIQIADGFLKKVKELQKIEFNLPANIILAASILLRYKSDYLRVYTEIPPEPQMLLDDFQMREYEDLPQLELASRIPPRRQITLDELVQEMEKIIRYDNIERVVKPKGGIEQIVNLKVNDIDIEKKMNEVFERISSQKDSEGWVMFSKIHEKNNSLEQIYALLSILHLTQKQWIDIKQDEIFKEIFIQVLKNNS